VRGGEDGIPKQNPRLDKGGSPGGAGGADTEKGANGAGLAAQGRTVQYMPKTGSRVKGPDRNMGA